MPGADMELEIAQQASEDPHTFQRASDTFLKWFRSCEGCRFNEKIELADLRCRNAGRGAVAGLDIAQGEELFAISVSQVLSAHNSDLRTRVSSDLVQLGSWDALIVTIIYEFLRRRDSPWFPYLNVLPTEFNTPMFWSAEQPGNLQGSDVLSKIGKQAAEENWKATIIPFMEKHADLFVLNNIQQPSSEPQIEAQVWKEKEVIRLAHMAGSLIMACAFDIDQDTAEGEVRLGLAVYKDHGDHDGYVEDDEEDPAKGMVPLADMLNADAERNNARLSHVSEHLIMEAVKPIQRGEEIFNDHGALACSAIFRMYGYITDNYKQYDLVELSTEMIYAAATDSRNKKSLQTPDLEEFCGVEDGYSVSRPETGKTLTQALDSDLQMAINAFASGDPTDLEKGRELSLTSLALLHDVLVKRLKCYKLCKAYEDSLSLSLVDRVYDADEAHDAEESELLQCLPSDQTTERMKMAFEVVRGEKKILKELLTLTDVEIATTKSPKPEAGPNVTTMKRGFDGGHNQNPSKIRKGR